MAEKTTKPAEPAGPRRVRATRTVFYGGMRIRPGKTFTITDPSHFSPTAMEEVDPAAPDDIATAVASSPKQRGSAGVTLKQPAASAAKGALDPGDRGI